MSTRYPGGFITRNPVAPTSASASGIWTQDQVLQYVRSGTWPQVYVPIYIEDVFSTYLYTGNGATQTITNNIDLSTKGGLVWIKQRSVGNAHALYDTARGVRKAISSNFTLAELTAAAGKELTAFNTTGFSLGTDDNYVVNANATTFASWTFRKQAKFFDVVTYTGNGTTKNIAHNLGSTPGCVIVKDTTSAGSWQTWHRGLTSGNRIVLNTTAAQTSVAIANVFGDNVSYVAPTSTQFTVGNEGAVNTNGNTYVAYIFAHDAGGFGSAGSDNVISCGGFTVSGGATTTVNLGYEPQWLLIKRVDTTGNWQIFDSMRGFTVSFNNSAILMPNLSDAEIAPGGTARVLVTSTGFQYNPDAQTDQMIYIAIRRGPMKTPTSGTSVFGLSARSGTGANATVTGSAGVSDAVLIKNRGAAVGDLFAARLTGTGYLETSSTAAEVAAGTTILQANPWDVMDGVKVGTTSTITNATSNTYINYLFDRAPGFFDVVCYTGNGSASQTVNHNLGVVPELVINKSRSVRGWTVFRGSTTTLSGFLQLNTTAAAGGDSISVSSTTITPTLAAGVGMNTNAENYVTYLFATVAGVSKVGGYTGTGTTKQIDCGFTAGARFVMIKRTDSTGDWYVWDSARGIVAGDDPYLLLNSTAAEVTNTDYVDTSNAGFEISSTAPAAINANGGTYIFLAIA